MIVQKWHHYLENSLHLSCQLMGCIMFAFKNRKTICFPLQSNSSCSIHTDLTSDLVKRAHLKWFAHHFKHSLGITQTTPSTVSKPKITQPLLAWVWSESAWYRETDVRSREAWTGPLRHTRRRKPAVCHAWVTRERDHRSSSALHSPDKHTHGWPAIIIKCSQMLH